MAGGSTEPNPKALRNAASELLKTHATLQQEVNALLEALANDTTFSEEVDGATFKEDREKLISLFKEGGVREGDIEIVEIDTDARIYIKICINRECLIIDIRW